MITGSTRLYAIIGDPIAHVRTPMAFNEYFLAQNIDAVCLPIHIGRDDLPRGWAGLKAIANLDGFIVTAPHKADSAGLCENLEGDGLHTKVVNTVRREPNGSFSGTLLDGRGFVSGCCQARASGQRPTILYGRSWRRRHRSRLCAGGRWRRCNDHPQPDQVKSGKRSWSSTSAPHIPPSTSGSAPQMPAATTSPSTQRRSGSSPTTAIPSILPASMLRRWLLKS